MTSTPKPVNGSGTNGTLGKRKKARDNRGTYLSKWLDKTMHHVHEQAPSMDTYESFVNNNLNNNWQMNQSQFMPNFDPFKYNLYNYTPEPVSLPTFPTYTSPMLGLYTPECRFVPSVNKSIQVHRPRQRRRADNKAEDVTGKSNEKLDSNSYMQRKNLAESQDFTSLPPIVTSVGDTTSNSDMNTNEKDDGSNARRYSDPCVRGLPDIAQATGADPESESEEDSEGSHVGSRLLGCLLDQISTLKTANETLNRELQETKAELQSVRQQNAIWQKGSPTALGSLPNQTPLGSNGLLGANYSPGMLSDLVREIRDATRVREENLYARIRSMVLEQNSVNGLSASDTKYAERNLDDLKNSMRAAELDKRRMLDRLSRLEDEVRALRLNTHLDPLESASGIGAAGGAGAGGAGADDADADGRRVRRELAEARRARHHAEEHALKLERLVTQLRSKFNGVQTTNGPESLPSESEHEAVRARRTSVNSNGTATVVFGPVTDL